MAGLLKKRFTILKEKYQNAKNHVDTSALETEEFLQAYERVLDIKRRTNHIKAAMKRWLASCQSLSKSGLQVSEAIRAGSEMSPDSGLEAHLKATLEENKRIIDSIRKKVQLLNSIVKQRKALEDLRLMRQHHAKEYEKLCNKDGASEGAKDKVDLKLQKLNAEYSELYKELHDAVTFTVQQCAEDPNGLIAVELRAFRTAQAQYFRLCGEAVGFATEGYSESLEDDPRESTSSHRSTPRSSTKKSSGRFGSLDNLERKLSGSSGSLVGSRHSQHQRRSSGKRRVGEPVGDENANGLINLAVDITGKVDHTHDSFDDETSEDEPL